MDPNAAYSVVCTILCTYFYTACWVLLAYAVHLSIHPFPSLSLPFLLHFARVKNDLPKIHRQLALSLLLTDVTFLIGVDRQAVPSPDGLCTTFAAVLHYFLLVTFTWMLIEGIHLCIKLVIVYFSKKIYIIYYFLGWGLPIIIVGITLGVRFCDYGSTAL